MFSRPKTPLCNAAQLAAPLRTFFLVPMGVDENDHDYELFCAPL